MRVLGYSRLGLGAAATLCVGVALAQPAPVATGQQAAPSAAPNATPNATPNTAPNGAPNASPPSAATALPTYPECTHKPTPQDVDGAKGAHKAAYQFYERGDYDKAIRYWNDAYAFDCTANDLLTNIASAYEKKGERASAIATYEAYLKRTGPNPTIEEKVKNLKALMAPPPPPEPPPVPTIAPTAPPTTAPTAPPPPVERPFGYTPWYVVGGGGALAIVGAILLPLGYSAISDAAKQCTEVNGENHCKSTNVADSGNAGRAKVGAGWALLSLGVAAVGGGLAWQFTLNKPHKPVVEGQKAASRRQLWVTPIATPGESGVVMGGSF